MRLLPRSPGGTWLLAAAAWAGLCGVGWRQLPVVPRMDWAGVGETALIGFVPGRPVLVTGRVVSDDATHRSQYTGPLRFWDADTGRFTELFDTGEILASYMSAVSPDGRWVAAYHGRFKREGIRLSLIDALDHSVRTDLPNSPGTQVWGATFSADGRWLAYAEESADRTDVRVWDLAAGCEHRTLRPGGIRIAFSPDGWTLAAGDGGGGPGETAIRRVRLWDVADGTVRHTLDGPAADGCWQVRFSPDGSRVAAIFAHFNEPSDLRVWATADGMETYRHDRESFDLPAAAPWFASGDAGPAAGLVLRDYLNGREVGRLDAPNEAVQALSADGRTACAFVEYPQPVLDWLEAHNIRLPLRRVHTTRLVFREVPTGSWLGELPFRPDPPAGRSLYEWAQLSPDGRLFAIGDRHDVTLWDVPPRKSLTWFALTAGLLLVPVGVLAWRRSRALRSERRGLSPPSENSPAGINPAARPEATP